MICIIIKGPTFQDAYHQISEASQVGDLVEIRLDFFTHLDFEALKSLQKEFLLPMIFTLRSQNQGGNYTKSEESRLSDIYRLAALNPEYMDLEYNIPPEFIQQIASQYPEIKLILSFHDFIGVPDNLDAIYHEMQQVPAQLYKLAVTPKNSLETMRLLCWKKSVKKNLIVIGMGDYGQLTRILGAVVGIPITFAALDHEHQSAPGQLTAEELKEVYHYRQLNPQTQLFGLIGDPIDKSLSHIMHNRLMKANGLDAVYVKIQVSPKELGEFLKCATQMSFRGLSVTMPLKEHVMQYLDHIGPTAKEIGAVNTLMFENNKIIGYNTDCLGALNALEDEEPVTGKHIVIIGAGGAAKAIAFESVQRGARVTIVNRDLNKAHLVAKRFGSQGIGFDAMAACAQDGYDILINCTPLSMPISSEDILPGSIVMDIVSNPKETEFLKCAKQKGCRIVYGLSMFIEQAIGQYEFWFKGDIDSGKCREILRKEI